MTMRHPRPHRRMWMCSSTPPCSSVPRRRGGKRTNRRSQPFIQDSSGDWSHAFIWQNNVMTDLNTLFPASSDLYATMANEINERGSNLGHGSRTRRAACWRHPRLSGNPGKRKGSHPGGYPQFSSGDDESDSDLFNSVFGWTDSRYPHASAVMLPGGSMFGRAILRGGAFQPLDSILVPGNDLAVLDSRLECHHENPRIVPTWAVRH
jgi:hypothetical protein